MENVFNTITLILLLVNLIVMYYMLKYNSNFLKQIQSIKGIQFDTLEIGDEAPLFRNFAQDGNRVITKKLFYDNKNTLMLFINTKCPICKEILKGLSQINKVYDLNLIIINNDEMFDDQEVRDLLPKNTNYIRSSQIPISYYIQSVPFAVLIKNGKIKLYNKVNSNNHLMNFLIIEKRKNVG